MYMMDTCAFLWYIETSRRLPVALRELIDNSKDMFISQVTLWEIAIKQTVRKIDLDMNIYELEKRCSENRITILPIETAYFERIKQLPLIHRDPFDRMIIATAIEKKLTLLTCDSNIMKYEEVKTLW